MKVSFSRLSLAGMLLGGWTGACAAEWVELSPVPTLTVPVPASARVGVAVPAGDIDIVGVSGDTLSAEMHIRCPDLEGRCASRLAEAAFEVSTSEEGVTLSIAPDEMSSFRQARVDVTVQVPRSRLLYLELGAGDVKIEGMRNCVRGTMFAGDLGMVLPLEVVRSVRLDTDVGDASIGLPGERREGRRSWLVGAVAEWEGGPGECDVEMHLRFGDLSLELVDGDHHVRSQR